MGTILRKQGRLSVVAFPLIWVCSVAVSSGATTEEGTPEAAPFRVRVPDGETAHALRRALGGADRRLAEPACREVLTDFKDAAGRTLKEVLDATGVSARTYLRWIVFSDGRDPGACGSRATLAVTTPGSRVVFVCPRAFVKAVRGIANDAEAILIHEMLHSLGLGENPPSTRAITRRVRARCAPPPSPAR